MSETFRDVFTRQNPSRKTSQKQIDRVFNGP